MELPASDSKPASGGRVSGPTSTPQSGKPWAIRKGSHSARGEARGFHVEEEGIHRSKPGSRKRAEANERQSWGESGGGVARPGR